MAAVTSAGRAPVSRAPPVVVVIIDQRVDELVEEVAVGRVDLDPVETGLDRALRGGDESLSRFVEPLVVEWVRLGDAPDPPYSSAISPGGRYGEGATGSYPYRLPCACAPACINCAKIGLPSSWTASTTRSQAAACSSVARPG